MEAKDKPVWMRRKQELNCKFFHAKLITTLDLALFYNLSLKEKERKLSELRASINKGQPWMGQIVDTSWVYSSTQLS